METLIKELNQYLSDLAVFYRKLQNYHWNIKGEDFFIVHEKLEEYYNKINDQIDEVAENILTLNGEPFGTLKDYLENTTITEAKNEKICSNEIFKNIIKDFELLLDRVKHIKEEAEKEKQYGTSSMVDEYILDYEKALWMLNQSL
jgi:starvation-inducible DNA-binding protein